jgi:hypothetical protein
MALAQHPTGTGLLPFLDWAPLFVGAISKYPYGCPCRSDVLLATDPKPLETETFVCCTKGNRLIRIAFTGCYRITHPYDQNVTNLN